MLQGLFHARLPFYFPMPLALCMLTSPCVCLPAFCGGRTATSLLPARLPAAGERSCLSTACIPLPDMARMPLNTVPLIAACFACFTCVDIPVRRGSNIGSSYAVPAYPPYLPSLLAPFLLPSAPGSSWEHCLYLLLPSAAYLRTAQLSTCLSAWSSTGVGLIYPALLPSRNSAALLASPRRGIILLRLVTSCLRLPCSRHYLGSRWRYPAACELEAGTFTGRTAGASLLYGFLCVPASETCAARFS